MVALRGNRGPDCVTCSPLKINVVLHPGSHRVGVCWYCIGVFLVEVCGHSPPPPISLYYTGVILVEERGHSSPPFPCTVQVLFPSRSAGIPPPPISLYCTGVISVEERGHSPPLPIISLYCTGVIPVEERGHSPPPVPPLFCWGPGLRFWDCVLSLHVAGHADESVTFLRLMVVASSRLPRVSEGVGLMSGLSMLSHLSTERL